MTDAYDLLSVGIWTTGNLENTLKIYSEVNLGCTALSSYGWLAYSVLQVSFKDYKEIKGIDAIIVNGFSWGFIGFMVMVLLFCAWESKGKVCSVFLFIIYMSSLVI